MKDVELTGTNRPCGLTTMHSTMQAERDQEIAIASSWLRVSQPGIAYEAHSPGKKTLHSVCRSLSPARCGIDLQVGVQAFGKVSGRHGEGETPVPIPNTAVKPLSADGTVTDGVTGE